MKQFIKTTALALWSKKAAHYCRVVIGDAEGVPAWLVSTNKPERDAGIWGALLWRHPKGVAYTTLSRHHYLSAVSARSVPDSVTWMVPAREVQVITSKAHREVEAA